MACALAASSASFTAVALLAAALVIAFSFSARIVFISSRLFVSIAASSVFFFAFFASPAVFIFVSSVSTLGVSLVCVFFPKLFFRTVPLTLFIVSLLIFLLKFTPCTPANLVSSIFLAMSSAFWTTVTGFFLSSSSSFNNLVICVSSVFTFSELPALPAASSFFVSSCILAN